MEATCKERSHVTEEQTVVDLTILLQQLAKPEVQQSLLVLLNHLPKLVEITKAATETYEVVQKLSKDRQFLADMKSSLEDIVDPLQVKAKTITSTAMEANERAKQQTSTIGIFGLIQMLKDPQIQHMLRFSKVFLELTEQRHQRR
ncbi:DUF1641 domain-containing protein [Paenibacillus agilis]|uniref:DUF1641 domain-containing protein n=1 Tax=Paenibacillus agilis TaxID=3020863 RepID=A0A559IVQ5_9BACL|nr:DUF1641 domain-containing protein [Paenibacillus agilis]TVX91694.1 DUF1641 domain-containing protein [Paenibacillus agilis]